jgi:hypothetical protein
MKRLQQGYDNLKEETMGPNARRIPLKLQTSKKPRHGRLVPFRARLPNDTIRVNILLEILLSPLRSGTKSIRRSIVITLARTIESMLWQTAPYIKTSLQCDIDEDVP